MAEQDDLLRRIDAGANFRADSPQPATPQFFAPAPAPAPGLAAAQADPRTYAPGPAPALAAGGDDSRLFTPTRGPVDAPAPTPEAPSLQQYMTPSQVARQEAARLGEAFANRDITGTLMQTLRTVGMPIAATGAEGIRAAGEFVGGGVQGMIQLGDAMKEGVRTLFSGYESPAARAAPAAPAAAPAASAPTRGVGAQGAPLPPAVQQQVDSMRDKGPRMERVASPASDAARRTAVEGAPTSPQTERRGPQPLAFGERRVDTPVRVTRGSRVSYEYPSGSTWDRYQKDPVYREQQALRYLETGGREGFMPARDRLALAAAQSRSRALDTIATQEFNRLMPAVVEAQNAIQEARAKRDVKALADAQARYNAANAQLYQFLRIINRNTPSPYDVLQQPQQPQQLKQKQ